MYPTMNRQQRQLLVEREFTLRPGVAYLNHAAVTPWPRRTRLAVESFARENAAEGARHYPRWINTEKRLREQLATLINAPAADDIALLKNTSEGLSVIAYGLEWNPGDNIVSSDEEFPSNRIVWESLRGKGVKLRPARLAEGASPEEALIAQIDGNTRLLAISSVQYASGLRLDLKRLGEYCRAHDVLFCVDAIQSVGAIATDVQADSIDFLVADGHKWMLGPEGVALFYCRADLRDQLRLYQYGWHMVEEYLDYDRHDWQIASTARRFECGSPNMLGIHALNASLSLLLEYGMEQVESQLLDNSNLLQEEIARLGQYELLSPREKGRYAGIVTFRHRSRCNKQLFQQLTGRGVVCARRGGGIRFSPHFHTGKATLQKALAVLAEARRYNG